MHLDVNALGDMIADLIAEVVEPLQKRINELESRALPTTSEVVREVLGSESIRTLVNMEAEAYLTENPPAAGEDGKSVTLDDVSLFLDAAISKHVLELERRATDAINRAIDKIPTPKDGMDGLGFEDAELVVDGDDAVLRFARGDVVKDLRIPLPTMKHIGFWQSGMSAKACETTTHDGSLWLALRDTSEMPSYKSADWQLAARKGRDGVDGKAPPKSGPVKLKDDDDA